MPILKIIKEEKQRIKKREKERPLTCAIRIHPSVNYKERVATPKMFPSHWNNTRISGVKREGEKKKGFDGCSRVDAHGRVG